MTDDNSTSNAKSLWQSQSVELPRMSSEFLRLRVEDVKRLERSDALSGYAAFALLTAWVVWVFVPWPANVTLSSTAWLSRLIAGLLYAGALYSAVRWHRFGGHRLLLGGDTNSSGLQTYRSELERSRESRRVQLDFSPFLPGYLVWVVSWWFFPTWPHHPALFMFVAASFAVTYVWSVWYMRRDVRRLNNEINTLQSLEI